MGRRAKAAKVKTEAKRPLARTAPKKEAPKVHELEKRVAEALEQQTATSEILRVISSSPTDAQPVFDTIAENAVRLCGARIATVFHFDGELIHLIAHHGYTPEALTLRRELFPAPPSAGSVTGRAILNRAVVHVADALADGTYPYRDFARAAGVRSVLAVPMVRDGRPIGAVTVSRAEPGGFAERHIELLQTFTDQAVIAIENVRLFREREAKSRDLATALEKQTATAEILRVISSSPTDVQPVFDTIIRSAATLCGAGFGNVQRFDGEFMHLVAHYSHSPEWLTAMRQMYPRRPDRTQVASRAVLSRSVVHVPDVLEDPEYPHDLALTGGFRSLVSVPMLRNGEPIGVITVAFPEATPVANAQIDLLKSFADQAVIAVENVRLFQRVQSQSQELERLSADMGQLYRLSTTMQEPLSLKEQLGRVLEAATRTGVIDRVYVWAVSAEADKLVNLAGAGFAADEWKDFELMEIPLVEAGAMYQAFREGQPLLFDDANPLPRELYLNPRYLIKAIRTSRFLVIPMIARGETVGVFAGDNKLTGRPISRKTVDLLQTFASHAAVAIANARLFQAIDEKSRELEAASRHKSEFLSNMSHELRTPLNAIIGFSEVLAERMFGDLTDKQAEYLQDIIESGRHLLSLINDILDLAKIEAGRMELELTEFDLPQAIDNALTLVRERAGRRGIALHRAVDKRLGTIRADGRKIKQVVLNLLSNALKFTPEGGHIEVRGGVVDAMAEISVADTGVGIAPGDQEAVFEEFRQVGTMSKKVEGTGLGLALCRKFVELHGGQIWVKSQVGQGSTFTFTLPLRS